MLKILRTVPTPTVDITKDDGNAIDATTIKLLERDAVHYTRRGQLLFAIATLAGLATIAVSYYITGLDVRELNDARDGSEMLILLLVRGTLFGSLSVGFLFGLFSVANAYIDQATRFRKRLYSAHMLNYAFRTFSDDIKRDGEVSLADLVSLFSAWNENVDSAFSRVKFQRKSPAMTVSTSGVSASVQEPGKAAPANGAAA